MKKYKIIYADPPWKYNVFSDRPPCARKPEEEYYDVMDLLDLSELPIGELADNDCVLFMWTTFPALPIALKLINKWGFHYRTVAFTWVKRNKKSDSWFWGMGGWTRANAEICLLATRGNPVRVSRAVHSILDDRITRHSEKPESARKRIIELMGNIPKVELFARRKIEGWDCWGNEIISDLDMEDYKMKTPQNPLKEAEFENLLDKASQPLETKPASDSALKQTSESQTSGDCSGIDTR